MYCSFLKLHVAGKYLLIPFYRSSAWTQLQPFIMLQLCKCIKGQRDI